MVEGYPGSLKGEGAAQKIRQMCQAVSGSHLGQEGGTSLCCYALATARGWLLTVTTRGRPRLSGGSKEFASDVREGDPGMKTLLCPHLCCRWQHLSQFLHCLGLWHLPRKAGNLFFLLFSCNSVKFHRAVSSGPGPALDWELIEGWKRLDSYSWEDFPP